MDKFNVLLDSHQVFILVETTEIDRAVDEIMNRVERYDHDFDIDVWTLGLGWDSGARDRGYVDAITSPVERGWRNKVLIYRNFGYAWDNPSSIPMLIEKLTRLYQYCDEYWNVCFFVGRIGRIPPEVLPFFATWDFPLPADNQLKELVKSISHREGLNVSKKDIELSALALKGLTMIESERAVGMAIASGDDEQPINLKVLHGYKAELVKKSGMLEYIQDTIDINSLGGMNKFKEHYTVVASYYHKRDEAQKFGLEPPRGCCLVGVQGCGKSLSAKVVANLFGLPLYRWDIGKLFGQYVGESEERTRATLKIIKAISPAVILVDEAEKMFSGGKGDTSSGVVARVLGSILYFMEEENKEGAFFYFTCNDIESLPPELIRSGRLDDIWFVDLPTLDERKEIFKIHIRKFGRNPDQYNIEHFAEIASDFTGADIANAVRKAMFFAFYENSQLKDEHIYKAIDEITPFGETHRETIEKLRAWAGQRAKPVYVPVKPKEKRKTKVRRKR